MILYYKGVSMGKRLRIPLAVLFLAVLGLIDFTVAPAVAVKEFKDAFQAKYIKPKSSAANDVALAEAFEIAG